MTCFSCKLAERVVDNKYNLQHRHKLLSLPRTTDRSSSYTSASISQKICKESKVHPRTGHEGQMGVALLFLNLQPHYTDPPKKTASIFGNLDLMIMLHPPIHVIHLVILTQFA